MKKQLNLMSGTMRAVLTAAVIFGLLAIFAFRQTDTAKVSAQTSETELEKKLADNPQVNRADGDGANRNAFGTLTTSDPTFNRPSSCGAVSGTTTRYDAIPFTVSVAGNVTLSFEAADGGSVSPNGTAFTGPDTFLILYSGTFNPASPLTNCTAFNDDISGSANRRSRITGNLAAGSYTAVVTSFNAAPVNTTDDAALPWSYSLAINLPTTITVNSAADPGIGACDANECTLREALATAGNNAVIGFSPLFDTPQTINLLTALPPIATSVTIVGKGANLLTVRRDYNAPSFSIFNILSGVANGVAISGMTITGGHAIGDVGGGIRSQSNLTLTNVHVTGNRADIGGGGVSMSAADGVFTGCTFSGNTANNQGGGINFVSNGERTLRVVSSTVSGNSSANFGGGINNFSNSGISRLEVVSSTIAGNTAPNGGGIQTATNPGATATTTLRNTIIATNTPNNLATTTFGISSATFQTLGFNLSNNFTGGGFTPLGNDITSATPRLAPLALYGGQTPTHALLAGSPAIDAGNSSGAATDQRGRSRPFDVPFAPNVNGTDNSDIGAVEMFSLFLVTNAGEVGVNSLRGAIGASPTNSDVLFDPTFFNQQRTITLGGTELVIDRNLNIIGTSANLLTVSGGGNSRVFSVNLGITAFLSGMTITGGNGVGATSSGSGGGILNNGSLTVAHSAVSGNTANGFGGGGIRNINAGTLTVTNSTISGNTANGTGGSSGGIDSSGNLTVINSTISDNRAPNGGGNGGGIWTNGFVVITNSTIANNSAAGANSASGVLRISATVTIRNSIIAGNVNNATQPDVVANGGGGTGITSNGFNLIGNRGTVTFNQTGDQSGTGASPLNPGLAALALNSGTTPTHALLFGSAALDAGNNSGSGTLTDQRGAGFNRTVDLTGINNAPSSDGTDIGAFEAQTAPPTPTVSVNDATAAEGDNVVFTLTLSAPTGNTVTLTYDTTGGTATPDVDYNNQNSPATLTFAPGTTTQTVSVPTFEDFTFEPDETFNLNILSAVNATIADNQGIGTILNDDPQPTISISDVSANEGNSGLTNFSFTVSLSAASSQTVTVNYQTANGTATAPLDYIAVGATTLTFAPGETSKQALVSVRGDIAFEPNETFFVNLSSPTNATISDNQGQGTIQNDDAQPSIVINNVSQTEGNAGTSNFIFTVELSATSTQTITVSYQTANGTATAGSDYTAVGATTLVFNAGETSKQVSISVNGDTTVEPDETFFVNLSAPTNATIADNQGIGTIQNDDVSQTFTVINTDDAGAGSLRQAIIAANNNSAPDTINFSALFNTPQTINLATALPDITTSSVTINGTGANLLTVRRAFNATTDFRIFTIGGIAGSGGVEISGMTISNGRVSGFGGGIVSFNNLTLTNVHVTGNQASNGGGGVTLANSDGVFTGCTFSSNTTGDQGGGIRFESDGSRTLQLTNSTVSGNTANGFGAGGGIFIGSGNGNGVLTIINSTIINNTGANGGGIHTVASGGAANSSTTTLRNTIIAGNTPTNLVRAPFDGATATVTSQGFNLSDNYNGVFTPPQPVTDIISATPRLAPLALNGGQTPTHVLLGGSPAIDKGDASAQTTDQRGVARVFDTGGINNASDGADIGAVEMRTIFVTNADDTGADSLRQAVATANAQPDLNDIIFDIGFFNTTARTITLTTGELVINSNTTINGAGANLLTVSGNNQSRVFFINSGFTASLNGMTITGGNGAGAVNSGFGGGIGSSGNLTISDSAISVNTANNGGGILSSGGTFNLLRSTVSGNTATFQGGGLNLQNGNGSLTNSTISGNTANSSSAAGGGIYFISFGGIFTLQATNCTIANNMTGTANTTGGIRTVGQGATASATTLLRNTIIAGNSLPNLRIVPVSGGAAAIMSQGFNLASDDGGGFLNTALGDKINANARLAALADNGGATPTHALTLGSEALDAGNNSGSGTLTDQRGANFRRTVDLPDANAPNSDGTDIGAVEAQFMPAADDIFIEGFVRRANGTPIVGATLILSGSVQATMMTDAGGHYRFTVPSGGSYQVSVAAPRLRFSPAQQSFNTLTVNQVADFMALPPKGRTTSRPRVR